MSSLTRTRVQSLLNEGRGHLILLLCLSISILYGLQNIFYTIFASNVINSNISGTSSINSWFVLSYAIRLLSPIFGSFLQYSVISVISGFLGIGMVGKILILGGLSGSMLNSSSLYFSDFNNDKLHWLLADFLCDSFSAGMFTGVSHHFL